MTNNETVIRLLKDRDLLIAKNILQDTSNELWNIHEQYKQNDFYTTDEIKSLCQDFAQDIDRVYEILKRILQWK